ncbi:MAG: hypothetical protein R3E61_04885 [Pseudomonadales bacterium]
MCTCIGRTGRAGVEGEALSLVCVDEHKLLAGIERLLKRELGKKTLPDEPDPSIRAELIPNGRQQNMRPYRQHQNNPQSAASVSRTSPNNGEGQTAQ